MSMSRYTLVVKTWFWTLQLFSCTWSIILKKINQLLTISHLTYFSDVITNVWLHSHFLHNLKYSSWNICFKMHTNSLKSTRDFTLIIVTTFYQISTNLKYTLLKHGMPQFWCNFWTDWPITMCYTPEWSKKKQFAVEVMSLEDYSPWWWVQTIHIANYSEHLNSPRSNDQ